MTFDTRSKYTEKKRRTKYTTRSTGITSYNEFTSGFVCLLKVLFTASIRRTINWPTIMQGKTFDRHFNSTQSLSVAYSHFFCLLSGNSSFSHSIHLLQWNLRSLWVKICVREKNERQKNGALLPQCTKLFVRIVGQLSKV